MSDVMEAIARGIDQCSIRNLLQILSPGPVSLLRDFVRDAFGQAQDCTKQPTEELRNPGSRLCYLESRTLVQARCRSRTEVRSCPRTTIWISRHSATSALRGAFTWLRHFGSPTISTPGLPRSMNWPRHLAVYARFSPGFEAPREQGRVRGTASGRFALNETAPRARIRQDSSVSTVSAVAWRMRGAACCAVRTGAPAYHEVFGRPFLGRPPGPSGCCRKFRCLDGAGRPRHPRSGSAGLW